MYINKIKHRNIFQKTTHYDYMYIYIYIQHSIKTCIFFYQNTAFLSVEHGVPIWSQAETHGIHLHAISMRHLQRGLFCLAVEIHGHLHLAVEVGRNCDFLTQTHQKLYFT